MRAQPALRAPSNRMMEPKTPHHKQTLYVEDTIVAQATAVGEGAVGIVRLSGAAAKSILKEIFHGKTDVQQFVSHHLYYGKICQGPDAEAMDDVLVVWMQAPHSYTGEDVVEIHGHGGRFLITQMLQLILHGGARLAEPGEFSKRAYLNGKMDLSQAEAVCDLITAKNEWAQKNALRQLEGFLSRTIGQLREKLIAFLARVEAGFDFVEEDVQTFSKSEGLQLLEEIKHHVKTLLDSFHTGQIYKDGLRVAILGKPNVGKSSLLNALLNEDKAIIHHEPGTTRDVVMGERKVHGLQVSFFDTAGIREASHPVELEGIRRSTQVLERADLVLVLLDSSSPLERADEELLQKVPGEKLISIYSKSDLKPAWDMPAWDMTAKFAPTAELIKVSAKMRTGIDELCDIIYKKSIQNKIDDHNYVLNNVRHKVQFEKVYDRLCEVTKNYSSSKLSEEILAEEVRIIINDLGEITGQIDNEEVLDEIFSKFCIGK